MKKSLLLVLVALLPQVTLGQQSSKEGESNQPKIAIRWKDGKTSFELGKASLELSNRMQVRFSLLDAQSQPTQGSFRIRRFKTKLEGWAYSKNLTFELQLNWADAKPLEDAQVALDLSRGRKAFVLKAGQFKVPFGRQELTSSGSQEFVDRSIVSSEFAKGRDIGVQLSGLAWGGKVDWRVGAFNGAGRNVTTNDNSKLQYNARITWQPLGEVKYSESDLANTPKPLFALAAQYEHNDRRLVQPTKGVLQETWGGDATFLFRGFYGFAELFERDNTPPSAASYTSRGLAIQGGYFLVPSKFELALRYAVVDPSTALAGNNRYEKGIAINYFFNRHAHKLQADIRRLEDQSTRTKSWEFRTQYQLIF